jgi:hypothetical protein
VCFQVIPPCYASTLLFHLYGDLVDRGFFILPDGKKALYRLVRVSLPSCQAAGADLGAGEVMDGLEAALRLLCTEGGRQISREDESRISASLDEEFCALLIEDLLPEAHRRAAGQQPGWYLPDGWPTSVSYYQHY